MGQEEPPLLGFANAIAETKRKLTLKVCGKEERKAVDAE
jgi:hypothetical protein